MKKTISEISYEAKNTILFGKESPYRLIHIMSRPPNYLLDWHSHRYFHVNYVVKGSVDIFTGDKIFTAAAGTVFVLPPEEPHKLFSENGYAQVGMDLQKEFDYTGIFALALEVLGSGASLHVAAGFKQEMQEFYDMAPGLSLLDKLKITNCCEKLLLTLIERSAENTSRSFRQRFLNLLKEENTSRLTVADICKKLYISKTHLERLTKQEFGSSVKEYLDEQRLSFVYYYLLETELSVDAIAEKTGFFDSSHFITFFKRHTGFTPGSFRRSELSQTKTSPPSSKPQ